MKRFGLTSCGGALLALCAACTPSLNWREVRFDTNGLVVLLPCKPDKAQRQMVLQFEDQAVTTSLAMQGCEAADLQFTWGQLAIPPQMNEKQVMAAWRTASLSAVGAQPQDASVLNEPLGAVHAGVTALRSQVQTPQHKAQWLWFADGAYVYQLAVYGTPLDKTLDEVAHVYFSGVKLP
jgi:hypothetical protein